MTALPSAKVEALLEQLQDVTDSGHRALVFSQFTGFLDVVRRRLDDEGVQYCYLDGKTRNRPTVLTRFKDGAAPVFLISLKAGGFGLNLTEADYCFLLDPWWNPATEAQAVDRTHRIGQTRNVMVYRLIAKDTIEEKVMALKAKKAELFASVMDDGNAFGAAMTPTTSAACSGSERRRGTGCMSILAAIVRAAQQLRPDLLSFDELVTGSGVSSRPGR